MININDVKNEELRPFIEELNKYTNDVHLLNKGVDIEVIEKIEKELGVVFPKIYKDFLGICMVVNYLFRGRFFQKYMFLL